MPGPLSSIVSARASVAPAAAGRSSSTIWMRPPAGMASAAFFTRFTSTLVRSSPVIRTGFAPPSTSTVSAIPGPARAARRLWLASSSAARFSMGAAGIRSQRPGDSCRVSSCQPRSSGLRSPATGGTLPGAAREAVREVPLPVASLSRRAPGFASKFALKLELWFVSSDTSFSTSRRLAAATKRSSFP